MENFTPISALIGGAMIGLAALLLMLLLGRIAGISGIAAGIFESSGSERLWRAGFVAGLILAPLLYGVFQSPLPDITISSSLPLLVTAGLLVGFGTRLGSGCTSGHGVCGLSRLSLRSLAATLIFMGSAGITLFVVRHLVGI